MKQTTMKHLEWLRLNFPTRPYKKESKARRQMARASRKKNRAK